MIETDIISSIAARPQAVRLVIRYIKTFKTDVIAFIGNFIICLTSHWPIIFSQTVDTDNILP